MKVIDLLNKIANGEITEDTLIEFDNGYKDYCSVRVFFDRYIVDRENLNCEVEIKEEEKEIPEKLEILNANEHSKKVYYENYSKEEISLDIETLQIWVNKIINYLKSKGE